MDDDDDSEDDGVPIVGTWVRHASDFTVLLGERGRRRQKERGGGGGLIHPPPPVCSWVFSSCDFFMPDVFQVKHVLFRLYFEYQP